jgi:ABC-type sugar transport system substrate-binding protein
MKRSEIKRRPLADTTLSGLEPEAKPYREQDGASLYSRVKLNGGKSWELRYKKADGKWSWLGLGGYPEVSDSLARQKAAEEQAADNTFERLAREWYASRLNNWDAATAKRVMGDGCA